MKKWKSSFTQVLISALMTLFVLGILMVTTVKAETVALTWDNPTAYVNGETLSDTDKAALIIVLENKASTATAWTTIGEATGGLNKYSYIVPTATYVRGSTIQFRCKARLIKTVNGAPVNYDSGYSNTVDWLVPYVNPANPKALTVTLNLTNATAATISVTSTK
jgi:hypothetical protein